MNHHLGVYEKAEKGRKRVVEKKDKKKKYTENDGVINS